MVRIALPVLIACLAVPAPGMAGDCPDTASSIAQARAALESGNGAQQNLALACLVEAVAELDARLTAITTGHASFEGPVYAPRGVIFEHHTAPHLNHVDAISHRATEEVD